MAGMNVIIHPQWRERNQCFMNHQLSTSISGKRKPENHKGEGEDSVVHIRQL
jgi:hypothetical protein